jgi:hypothetical protein
MSGPKCVLCGVLVNPGPKDMSSPVAATEAAYSRGMGGYICWMCDMDTKGPAQVDRCDEYETTNEGGNNEEPKTD